MPRVEQGGTIGGVTVPPMPTSSSKGTSGMRSLASGGAGVTQPLAINALEPIQPPSIWDTVGGVWSNLWRQIPGASGTATVAKTIGNLGDLFTNPLMLMMLMGGGRFDMKKLLLVMLMSGGNIDPMMLMLMMSGGNIDPLMLMLMMGEANTQDGQTDPTKAGMFMMMSKNRATRTMAPLVLGGLISAGSAITIASMNMIARRPRKSSRRSYRGGYVRYNSRRYYSRRRRYY